jgi:hypothetical protein
MSVRRRFGAELGLTLLLCALAWGPAWAETFRALTVAELVALCRNAEPASAAACKAEVNSLARIMATLGTYATKDRAGHGVCPSGNPTFDAAAATQAFLAWAQAHPDQGANAAGGGVIAALRERWPCPGG